MKKLSFITFLIFSSSFFTLCEAQYDTIISLSGTKGAYPNGSLTLSVNRNALYGMTAYGGLQNYGCIFSMDTNGSRYNDIYDFDSIEGFRPNGTLTLIGKKLYGMTSAGGAYDSGCIFSIDTIGTNYKDLFDFNFATGCSPNGSLILAGNKLYGMTSIGGIYAGGVIFSIDTNGSQYKHIFNLGLQNGVSPQSSLILSGSKLFGTAIFGGSGDSGTVFTMDTNGNNYKAIHNFSGTDGSFPVGALTLSGNVLYGMTYMGGANHWGVIFAVDTDGGRYKDMLDLSESSGGWPQGNLTLSGPLLYGMASFGGLFGFGGIFSIDTDGSSYNTLYGFSSLGEEGEIPTGSLTTSLPGTFYGMTSNGGAFGVGVVFKLKSCSNTYTEPICIVTVDTAINATEVIWGRTNSPPAGGFGYYRLYKDTLGVPLTQYYNNSLYYVQQPLDSLTEFTDTAGSASVWGATYFQLSTIDSCGESQLSPIQGSIFLTITPGTVGFVLNWNAYTGFTPTEYRIFRRVGTGPLIQIDSVPNYVLTYKDTVPPAGSIYAVEAVNPGICIPTRHGPHKISAQPFSGSFSNQFNSIDAGFKNIVNNPKLVKAFPNPSNGIFTLALQNVNEPAQIEIYNVFGEKVYATLETFNSQLSINLSAQPEGIYLYRIISEGGELLGEGKVIIQK